MDTFYLSLYTIYMIDSIKRWFSLRRNANFWAWMKDTYTVT